MATSRGVTYSYNYYYGRFDENGDTLWTRQYGLPEHGNKMYLVKELEDQNLLFLGLNYDNGSNFSVVFKTDKDGNVLWHRNYRYFNDFRVYNFIENIAPTPFGGILMVGSVFSQSPAPGFDTTGQWGWIMLTDSFGCVQPGCQDTVKIGIQEVNANIPLHIYPNPANDKVIIEFLEPGEFKDARLNVYNMIGELVYHQNSVGKQTIINTTNWKSGLYVVEVSTNGSTSNYKLVVQ